MPVLDRIQDVLTRVLPKPSGGMGSGRGMLPFDDDVSTLLTCIVLYFTQPRANTATSIPTVLRKHMIFDALPSTCCMGNDTALVFILFVPLIFASWLWVDSLLD
jgi:hypothetical protein